MDRIRRRTVWAGLLAVVSAIVFSAAFAGGTAAGAEGESRGKLVRVGWYESSFNRTDENGRRSGYAYEYQMKIAAYAGWRFEYIEGSWSELLQMLIDGEIDLMSDVSYTEERAEKMLFPSVAMGAEDYYLFVSVGNREISSSDYSTLNGKKIGVNKDSIQALYYREWAEKHGIEGEVTELTTTEEESMRMLSRGAIDAYITVDSFTTEFFSEPERPIPICKIGSSEFYFAVSRERPELLEELEKAMNRIQEENRYYSQQLAEKHLVSAGANAFLTPEEQAWLEAHGGKIRVAYQDGYLAFCAQDPESGELTGALKDYLESAEDCVANAHIQFEAKAYKTAMGAIEAVQKGEADCVFPANMGPGDGEKMGLFMTPALMQTDVFAVVWQADRQIFSGRQHVVVAVNEGNPNYEDFLKDEYPEWHIVYYPTTAECLKAVSRGVADCVLISSYRYNNIAQECERLRLTTVTTGTELDFCFGVAGGNPELYSILAKTADLVPKFKVNTALSKYITEDAKTSIGDFFAAHPWIVVAAAGALAVSTAALAVILATVLRRGKPNESGKRKGEG